MPLFIHKIPPCSNGLALQAGSKPLPNQERRSQQNRKTNFLNSFIWIFHRTSVRLGCPLPETITSVLLEIKARLFFIWPSGLCYWAALLCATPVPSRGGPYVRNRTPFPRMPDGQTIRGRVYRYSSFFVCGLSSYWEPPKRSFKTDSHRYVRACR